MDLFKKLQEIENHFKEISVEDFEEKLIKAGYEMIEHSNQFQMKMITSEELKEINNEATYSIKGNYTFNTLPDKVMVPVMENMLLLEAS